MSKRAFPIGPNGETYNPTLKAPASYNVEKDCLAMREAMQGLGTDETKLIEILGSRTEEQRLAIRAHYKSSFGDEILDRLKSELSGNFKDLAQMLLVDSSIIKARSLYYAMKGAGTTESVITEVLCTSTNKEIEEVKEAYKQVLLDEGVSDASRTLEKDLKSELSGDYERLIVAMLQAKRDELTNAEFEKLKSQGVKSILNVDLVNQDVNSLYDAGEGRLGTDEKTFIRVLVGRHVWHLAAVAITYEKKTGKSLIDAIDSETGGDFGRGLKLLLFTNLSRLDAYAELLKNAMAGLGTTDDTLMRIIVTRCEIDLGDIATKFANNTGQTLEQWIRGDTSGDYQKLLLALLGANWRE